VKKTAIVGCGNIAGFLDTPQDEHITTHAHAYLKHPDTNLIAVCDPDPQQRKRFLSRWGEDIHAYENLEELLKQEQIDVLSICSPTPFHAQALQLALNDKNLSAILCEKPLIQTQQELDEISMLLEKTDKRVLVNFIRRYDPSIQDLKRLLRSQELGSLLHFNATFTKGLYHNGSHMLELIENLCGEILSIRAEQLEVIERDLYGSFYLETTSARGSIHNESAEAYALFELELVLSNGRIKIKDSGHLIEIERVQASKRYPGYFTLGIDKTLPDTLNNNILNALSALLTATEHTKTLKEHLHLSQKLLNIKQELPTKHFLEFT